MLQPVCGVHVLSLAIMGTPEVQSEAAATRQRWLHGTLVLVPRIQIKASLATVTVPNVDAEAGAWHALIALITVV